MIKKVVKIKSTMLPCSVDGCPDAGAGLGDGEQMPRVQSTVGDEHILCLEVVPAVLAVGLRDARGEFRDPENLLAVRHDFLDGHVREKDTGALVPTLEVTKLIAGLEHPGPRPVIVPCGKHNDQN